MSPQIQRLRSLPKTGLRKVNSLVSAERINFTGGSLAVMGSAHLFAPATLDGAELSGGTWGFSHGLVVSGSFSNRLSWIAIHSGDVLLHTPSAYLRLCGSVGLGAGDPVERKQRLHRNR